MENSDDRNSIHEAAREAIDEDELARVLALAADGECGEDAVVALREVAADEIVADALAAARGARRRGRPPTGDDVGNAADERRECCPGSPRYKQTLLKMEPAIFEREEP